jgi:hypothetical protein
MARERALRIKFQESGGGWGNPLMGLVFDSNLDVPEEELGDLVSLVERCDLSRSGELEGRPPTDTPKFALCVEKDGEKVEVFGDVQRSDKNLRSLINFIRRHGRKELLE